MILNREIQKNYLKNKNNNHKNISNDIEKHSLRAQTKGLFSKIKSITQTIFKRFSPWTWSKNIVKIFIQKEIIPLVKAKVVTFL